MGDRAHRPLVGRRGQDLQAGDARHRLTDGHVAFAHQVHGQGRQHRLPRRGHVPRDRSFKDPHIAFSTALPQESGEREKAQAALPVLPAFLMQEVREVQFEVIVEYALQ